MKTSAWDQYVTGRHARLIAVWAERLGMQTHGFHAACRRRLSLEPWRSDGLCKYRNAERDANDEVLAVINSRKYLPDAFRFVIEGYRHGWGHPVLVIEVLEVTVTHETPEHKLAWYEQLWWACDATERLEFRAVQTYDDKELEELMGQDMAYRRLTRDVRAAA